MFVPKASPPSGSRLPSGVGSHARNWTWACRPGILGPPVSLLPRELITIVEHYGCGPPTSWKLSQNTLGTTLDLHWIMNTGHPSNSFNVLPPALMSVVASFNSPPSSWSLDRAANLLCCHLSWSHFSVPVSSTPDSGYSSPPAPRSVSPTSPVPFNLPDSTLAAMPSTVNLAAAVPQFVPASTSCLIAPPPSFADVSVNPPDDVLLTVQVDSSLDGDRVSHVKFKSYEDNPSTLSVRPDSALCACQTEPPPASVNPPGDVSLTVQVDPSLDGDRVSHVKFKSYEDNPSTLSVRPDSALSACQTEPPPAFVNPSDDVLLTVQVDSSLDGDRVSHVKFKSYEDNPSTLSVRPDSALSARQTEPPSAFVPFHPPDVVLQIDPPDADPSSSSVFVNPPDDVSLSVLACQTDPPSASVNPLDDVLLTVQVDSSLDGDRVSHVKFKSYEDNPSTLSVRPDSALNACQTEPPSASVNPPDDVLLTVQVDSSLDGDRVSHVKFKSYEDNPSTLSVRPDSALSACQTEPPSTSVNPPDDVSPTVQVDSPLDGDRVSHVKFKSYEDNPSTLSVRPDSALSACQTEPPSTSLNPPDDVSPTVQVDSPLDGDWVSHVKFKSYEDNPSTLSVRPDSALMACPTDIPPTNSAVSPTVSSLTSRTSSSPTSVASSRVTSIAPATTSTFGPHVLLPRSRPPMSRPPSNFKKRKKKKKKKKRNKTTCAANSCDAATNYTVRSSDDLSPVSTGTKLHILNLDFEVTDTDIRHHFSAFGKIQHSCVHYDALERSYGTAEVVYHSRDDALNAVKQCNGAPFYGRLMKLVMMSDVNATQQRDDDPFLVNGFDPDDYHPFDDLYPADDPYFDDSYYYGHGASSDELDAEEF